MTDHSSSSARQATCAAVPRKIAPNTPVSFIVGGLEYRGTFIRSIDDLVQVRDPFEDNFIAARAIQTSAVDTPLPCTNCNIGKNANARNKHAIQCGNPKRNFQAVLKRLLSSSVLIQFDSTILSGTVVDVTRRSVTVDTSSASAASAVSTQRILTSISLSRVSVVLVPLSQSKLVFGDPTMYNITAINASLDPVTRTLAVFSAPV